VEHCAADMSDAADRARLLQETEQRLGGVDVLVNNAGGPPPIRFDALDDDKWHLAHELNRMSMVRLIRGVLPHMRQQGWGRIVTVASSSIKQPIENLLLSNTYRVAILGLAKSLAIETAPDGILINTVGPRADRHRPGRGPGRRARREVRHPHRGGPRADGEADPTWPLRHGRGVPQGGGVPGLRGEHLHDRAAHPGRRRHGEGHLMRIARFSPADGGPAA